MKSFFKKIIPENCWIALRLLKLRVIKKRFKRKIVEHCYGGHNFKVLIADPLGQGWYQGDWERLKEIEELSQSRLKKGALVFDCGAHQSVVAMMLGKEVGESGKVIAIEATRHNYEVALENLKMNHLSQVINLHCAIGATMGEATISESFNAAIVNGPEWGQEQVKMINLNFLAEKYGNPQVIFIDIEGLEGQALEGASNLFALSCDWFVEIHGEETLKKFGGSVRQILNYFPRDKFVLKAAFEGQSFLEIDFDKEIPAQYLKRFFLLALHRF